MKGKKKKSLEEKLSPEEFKLVSDLSVDSDIVSVITCIPVKEIAKYRYALKYRDALRQASRKYRAKLKKSKRTYDFWSAEEIKYILTGRDTDVEMAKKLGRSLYAVQKKRERELRKKEKGGDNGRNNKKDAD